MFLTQPRSTFVFLLAFGVITARSPLYAQSAENVALIINDASADSQRVGDYYLKKRSIPAGNVIRIRTSTEETVERIVYDATIEQPIAAALARANLQDRVLYIVLTKGVPIRINGTVGQTGTVASVDSELTLLYRKMVGGNVPIQGRLANPYFLGDLPVPQARPFTHRDFDIFLVTRLDAFTVDDVIGLIDRGSAPAKEGRIVLDQQDKLVNRTGEDWLEAAATALTKQGNGARVLLEGTVAGVRDVRPVMGYFSWGSNDPRNRTRSYGLGFVPGSLAATFVSTDARTFKEPPPTWTPGPSDADRRAWFGSSAQSLVGDLIREGATGLAGHVAEPYVQSTVRPQVLFPAYLSGANLVQSFYLAMPHLSWQNMVLGDPLCAPFASKRLTRAEIEDSLDPMTTLPGIFSKHRQATLMLANPTASARAIELAVRGEALVRRGDAAGRTALEEATALAPTLAQFQLQLALLYEREGNRDAAAARYRKVIEVQPQNPLALNNLAYLIAVHEKKPADAIPLAQRAQTLAPSNPVMLDTLGWVLYLSGDRTGSLQMLIAASQAVPANPGMRVHAAFSYAASGNVAAAQTHLTEALKLQPALETTDEVKELRAILQKAQAR